MIISLLLAAASAGPVMINEPVKDKPAAELSAGETYLMVRSGGALPTSLAFFREADPAEVESYRKRRADALSKAHAKWVKQHANWVEILQAWKDANATFGGSPPEEPIEPTEATLDFPTIEQEQLIVFGP